jgi:hypothetical protein
MGFLAKQTLFPFAEVGRFPRRMIAATLAAGLCWGCFSAVARGPAKLKPTGRQPKCQIEDASSPAPILAPAWTKSYPAGYPLAAISENGRCAAVAGNAAVEVIDSLGNLIWRWDYGRANRFIQAGSLALSPTCNAVALAGTPSYRYTWLADKRGGRTSVATTGTPGSLSFDHKGELVAVATGAGELLLVTKDGVVKWKRDVSWAPAPYYPGRGRGGLAFSADDTAILGSSGVVKVDGTVVWTGGDWGMDAARDLRTFVTWWVPNHGSEIGNVSTRDQSGKTIWEMYTWTSMNALISESGDTIIALVSEDQNPGGAEEKKLSCLQLISRSGDVQRTLRRTATPGDAEPISLSPDGRRLLVRKSEPAAKGYWGAEAMDMEGNALFEVPNAGNLLVAADMSAFLTFGNYGEEARIEWYDLRHVNAKLR